MKKILCVILSALTVCVLTLAQPALAADTALGAKVFTANCAACHSGGINVIAAAKNLKKESLQQYGMDSTAAIVTQVTNGKGAMPSFKSRLSSEQIEAVAAYVLDQADKGWAK